MRVFFPLCFHCPICQAADNIALHEDKNQYYRHDSYNTKCHGRIPQCLILLYIVINTGSDWPHIRIGNESNPVYQISPCIYEREYCRDNDSRPCYGKHDFNKRLYMSAAINLGCLIQFLGNRDKVSTQYNNAKRNPQCCICQNRRCISI